jgi:hypothetical protein
MSIHNMLRCVGISFFCVAFIVKCSTAQQPFLEVAKLEVSDAVLKFAANRELFRSYCCRGILENEEISEINPMDDEVSLVHFCISENLEEHAVRRDWAITDLESEDFVPIWETLYDSKAGRKRYVGDLNITKMVNSKVQAFLWRPGDPWVMPFAEKLLAKTNRCESALYWAELFQDEKLLWAEGNGQQVRGEWRFGNPDFECYVQAYFDRNVDDLPVYVRFIKPVDKKEKFSKKSLSFVSEISTKWQKHGDGWVPESIQQVRENLARNGKVKSVETWSITFEWSSLFQKDNNVADEIFEPGKIGAEELFESFKRK